MRSINPILILFIILIFPLFSLANEENHYTSNTFGNIGLIQTPNARLSDDGSFSFGMSSEDPYNRIYSRMQFFPWLEGTVRYTEGTYKPYYEGNEQTWKDKGIDFKFRILQESAKTPAIAIGLTDFGGTGAFGSEYIAASKMFGKFDLTLGLGYGQLNGKNHINNPFKIISDSFDSRTKRNQLGGKLNLGRFFSGESASFFGGVEYHTPIDNLNLKLEYDSSDYSAISGKKYIFNQDSDLIKIDSEINFSLNYVYEINEREKATFSLGYVRGNTIYANVNIETNIQDPIVEKFPIVGEKLKKSTLNPYDKLNPKWKKYASDSIIWQLGNQGFATQELIFNDDEIIAELSQGRFLKPIHFIDIAARVISMSAPKNIKKITIVNVDHGLETLRASIDKEKLISIVSEGPLKESDIEISHQTEIKENASIVANDFLYPNFFWEIKPHLTGTIQHQEKFYFWQLEALLHAEYSIKRGLYLTTDIGINIDNNFDGYTYHVPDGQLHHVRQDRRLYLTEGETGIRRLALDYNFRLNKNINARVSAGYLEWMFAGAGGEIIYMPDNKDWAIGAELFYARQRDFNQRFSLQDYSTLTGYISYYRDLPFYDMRLKVNAGKFLGKDVGMLIDISRRFDTGARVGGMVALTDCDSQCVGEGSFNKWIYFEFPMEMFYIQRTTRHKAGYTWSPLTKDAGAKLGTGSLYDVLVNAKDEVEIVRKKEWSIKKILKGFSTSSTDMN